MLKIRLTRLGKKHRPFYRIIVAEARSKRNGRYLENLGYYDPLTNPPTIKINNKKYQYWLSVGAKPSEAVNRLYNSD